MLFSFGKSNELTRTFSSSYLQQYFLEQGAFDVPILFYVHVRCSCNIEQSTKYIMNPISILLTILEWYSKNSTKIGLVNFQ